jgi:RNA polymerase sigma-70 factor (ECF subfamily)
LAHRPASVDLEDLLQDVAAVLIERLAELRDWRGFRGWLRAVAINAARGAGRKAAVRDPRRVYEKIGESFQAQNPAVALEVHEERDRVLQAFAALPPDDREVLALRSGHGYSQREIARLLDVPETTVETRLSRARKKLRALLEDTRKWQGEHGTLSG